MSSVTIMAGYAIKISKVGTERANYLYLNFDERKFNEWQWMYDESGYECIVYITEYQNNFIRHLTSSTTMQEMLHYQQSAIEFSNQEPAFKLGLAPEMIHFVSIWDEHTALSKPIFQEKEDVK